MKSTYQKQLKIDKFKKKKLRNYKKTQTKKS